MTGWFLAVPVGHFNWSVCNSGYLWSHVFVCWVQCVAYLLGNLTFPFIPRQVQKGRLPSCTSCCIPCVCTHILRKLNREITVLTAVASRGFPLAQYPPTKAVRSTLDQSSGDSSFLQFSSSVAEGNTWVDLHLPNLPEGV